MPDPVLVIACGAIAREVQQIKLLNNWEHMRIECIDAKLHFQPQLIAGRVQKKIRAARGKNYSRIFVAYVECGTGGELDRVLAEEKDVERLAGLHCYQFFAGTKLYEQLSEEEPGTFFLTDFLAQYFDRFVVKSLKLDEHPELIEAFFGNYKRVVYISQLQDSKLMEAAKKAAEFLQLDFQHLHRGYGELETGLKLQMQG